MQDLLELPNNPSLFSLACEVSKGKFAPHIKKQEAFSVLDTCENPFRKNIVTCKDNNIDEFLNEAQGLELDTILDSCVNDLPYYIPVFDRNIELVQNLPKNFPVVALSLKDIITSGITYKAGCLHEEKSIGMRRTILQAHCFKGKKVLLFASGPDTLIESIWYKRDEYDFFAKISKMGFYAATGFNFSLIIGECPFAQALNMKRSLISASLFEQTGTLTIPHIYALTKYQVAKWCVWLNKNQNIKYFTINCQLQNSWKDITHVIQAIRSIFNSVSNIHVILHGFPINRIKDFNEDIIRVHFADMLPLKKARNYRRMIFKKDDEKIRFVKDDKVSIAELITDNFNEKLAMLNYIKQQNIEKFKIIP